MQGREIVGTKKKIKSYIPRGCHCLHFSCLMKLLMQDTVQQGNADLEGDIIVNLLIRDLFLVYKGRQRCVCVGGGSFTWEQMPKWPDRDFLWRFHVSCSLIF